MSYSIGHNGMVKHKNGWIEPIIFYCRVLGSDLIDIYTSSNKYQYCKPGGKTIGKGIIKSVLIPISDDSGLLREKRYLTKDIETIKLIGAEGGVEELWID